MFGQIIKLNYRASKSMSEGQRYFFFFLMKELSTVQSDSILRFILWHNWINIH